MQKRIDFVFNILGGAAALLVLFFVVSTVITQLQKKSIAGSQSQTNVPAASLAAPSRGDLIAFVSNQGGNNDIYTMKADGSDLINLTNNPADDNSPVWSPDGMRIAFVSNRDSNENIYVMNFDGSGLTRITDDRGQDTNPVWSPDGTKIAYASGDFSKNNTNIYVVDANGQNQRRLTHYVPNTTVWPEEWSPDSQFILFNVYRQIVQVGINDGMVTPLTPQTDVYVPNNFNLSADGSTLTYLAECNSNDRGSKAFCNELRTINRYGTNVQTQAILKLDICAPKETITFFKWSPDQTKILFAFTCGDTGRFYIANADGSGFKPFTNYPILGNTFDWSPDSQSVVFTSRLDKPTNLYILNINDALRDPSIKPTLITNSTALVSSPAWQPAPDNLVINQNPTPEPTQVTSDNRLIAFTAQSKNGMDIFAMQMDGNNIFNLTKDPAQYYDLVWSPDGKQLAFIKERNGNPDIFVMNPDGSGLTQSTNNKGFDGLFSWSPDGQKIVYLSRPSTDPNSDQLISMNPDGSHKTVLTKERGSYNFLGWLPDEQRIIYSKLTYDPVSQTISSSGAIYTVNSDGSNQQLIQSEGMDQVHWTDDQHIYGMREDVKTRLEDGSELPYWTVYKLNTDNTAPLQLASYGTPVVALFDNAYLVEGVNALQWYSYDDSSKPMASWSFWNICNDYDKFFADTTHSIAPDKTHALGSLYCSDGKISFYFEKTDGSTVTLLPGLIIDTHATNGRGPLMGAEWSSDGKYALIPVANPANSDFDIYLLNVAQALADPATKPIKLVTGNAGQYGIPQAAIQPQP